MRSKKVERMHKLIMSNSQFNKISECFIPKTKTEGSVKDLHELTQLELLDIRERQTKLLSNRERLQKLPDKGKRVKDFYENIQAELNRRTSINEAAELFSKLNIVTKGRKILDKMEWNGNFKDSNRDLDSSSNDSDNNVKRLSIKEHEEIDEHLIKQLQPDIALTIEEEKNDKEEFVNIGLINAGMKKRDTSTVDTEFIPVYNQTTMKNVKSEMKSKDQEENNSGFFHTETQEEPEPDIHVSYLIAKTEIQKLPMKKTKFLPHRTIILKNANSDNQKTQDKPFVPKFSDSEQTHTQMLSLTDSINIQSQYLAKMKELHEKQAVDRLAKKMQRLEKQTIKIPNKETIKTNPAFKNYRNGLSAKGDNYVQLIEGAENYDSADDLYDHEN